MRKFLLAMTSILEEEISSNKISTHLIGIVRRLNERNRFGRSTHPSRTLGIVCSPPWRTCIHLPRPGRQSQPIHFREAEETPSIDEEIILSKARFDRHGRRGMRDHLEDMIATHRPREVNDSRAGARIVHLLSISQYQTLSGRDGPDHGHIMLLAATGNASGAGLEGFGVGKSKTPSDATFGVGDAFTAGYGREIDGVEGTVGSTAAPTAMGLVPRTTGGGSAGGRHSRMN